MARYTVDILDNSGQRIGFVPAPASPEYRRRQNQATSFSFGVLMDDDVGPLLTHGRQCILRREGVERVAGTVTRRDASGQVMRVECITNEALLRDIVTPADWNYWAGWQLGDAVRDLLMDFAIQARNTPDDWAAAIEKVDVDLTTWPGKVVLAKDATGHYKSHGYITLQFDFGSVSKYQVLRWAEDAGQEVRIKAQFRTSANGTSWGAWSEELQSVFPAEDGVALTGSERYIQIKMHLYTDNTSEKDVNGVPTGYTPVLNGVEVIARRLGSLTEGVIEATPDVTIPAYRSENEGQKETYSFNRENALRILQTWCEDYGYEFRVDGQRRLYFGKDLGAVRQVVLRRTTNMDVKSLGDSADKLANVLHCYGAGDGPAQIRTILRNQDSINLYGERHGEFEDTSADTPAKLTESGNKRLAKVSQPEPQFVVHHVPVHDLGEDLQLYDTVTVVDPRSGLVSTARILDEERKLAMAGEDVSLGLNCDLDNIIERIVKGQAKRPRPGGLPPEAPRNLRAYGGYGYIHLTWAGEGEVYIVEHSLNGESFERLDHTGYRNYLHAGLDIESAHYYRVRAMRYGMVSPPSETVSAIVATVRDDEPPATPTGLAATGNAELLDDGTLVTWVDLTWTPNAEPDLHDYAIQRRAQGADEWQQLIVIAGEPGITARYRDEGGLVAGGTYEYQIAAGDFSGNRSEWSATAAATIPDTTTGPPKPTGLAGQFVGGDAMFAWDPCPSPAFKRSCIQIVTSDVVRRTAYTNANTFTYTLSMNRADHSAARPNVTVKVAHEDRFGNRSAWASATAIKQGPAKPAWLSMSSTISQIIMDVAPPDAVEVAQAEFQLAARSDYADATTTAKGAQYTGVLAPARTTGTNYGRVRYIDVFGQAGSWTTGSCTAKLIGKDDMQGAIFQITPSSTPAPSSGALEQLWDADTGTGPMFGSAPTIEFEYPIAELTDLVRFFVDRSCTYYVQAYNEQAGAWVDVVGSATAKVAAAGGQWHVRQFDGGKLVAARQLRIIFDRALKVTELKFWRAVIADEILVGAIKAWQIDTESIFIGDLGDGDSIPRTIDEDEAYFPFDGGLASTRGIQPTFTRASAATNPDTGATVAANEPRFVAGKFGQAVLVEEGTTNLLSTDTATLEGGLGDWTAGAGVTIARVQDSWPGRVGSWSLKVSGAISGTQAARFGAPLVTGVTRTASVLIHAPTAMTIGTDFYGNAVEYVSLQAGETRRIVRTWMASFSSGEASFRIWNNTGALFYCDQAQYEEKPYATSFADGTRAAELLDIPPADTLDFSAGTIELWYKPAQGLWNGSYNAIIGHSTAMNVNELRLARSGTGSKLLCYASDASGQWSGGGYGALESTTELAAGTWYHLAFSWQQSGKLRLYINGIKEGEINYDKPPSVYGTLAVGYRPNYSARYASGRYAGLRIHRRALSDEEIAAHAQAAAASYDPRSLVGAIDADVRPINLVNNQITLDSTGLKMRRAGESVDRMHLDARRLGFRDPSTGAPTAGIGYVRDLAQELDPEADPETLIGHGLFVAQGEIRASQSVLSESLTEGGTGMTKLADGSVALPKLADTLSVTLPNRFVLHVGQTIDDLNILVNPGFESGGLQGWVGTGAIYSGSAHTGTYSVYNCNIYQDVAASAGQAWTGQAWLRDSYEQSYVTLQFLNASKTVLSTHDSPVCGRGGWHCLYVTAVAPANTTYARLVIKTQNNYTGVRFDDCALARTGIATSYTTFLDTTLPAADACEQLKVNTSIDNPSGVTVYTRVLVNGTVVLDTTGVTQPVTASVTLDTRGIDGDIRVQVQAKTNSGVATWDKVEVHHNQRLPLRGAPPLYTITEDAESSCGAPCEASCQTQCQKACEAACQSTCQDACQHACESTCEKTSQGGGCWVTGTPVTVIEGDHIYDIPVEELEPGMMMPWYDPVSDSVQESKCLSNQRTYTHTIYVAAVEGGYTLEMTGEQPMDVLRSHYATGNAMWHKLPARYIRPGDKLVRPFDGTLHEVLSLERTQRTKTWVYNPRTVSGRYIVHGFADSTKELT